MLYTHEELTDPITAQTGVKGDFNNSCVTFQLLFDGAKVLITGDINKPAMEALIKNQRKQLTKHDAVQTSHHFYNDLRSLYSLVRANFVFIPSKEAATQANNTRKQMFNLLKNYAGDNIYYAANATQGFVFRNEAFVEIYNKPALGTVHTGWSW